MSLPEAELEALRKASMDILQTSWRNRELAPVIGFDGMAIDRMVFTGIIPPRSFSISEGYFDEELIAGKLADLGYETAEHGAYTYYTKGEDFNIDMGNELSRMVLSSMNRLAVLDDTVVAAPSTEKITTILDTMAGDVPSVIDSAACRALADSLGEVLTAVMTTPDRVTSPDPNMGGIPAFGFTIPEDWGLLHRYEMAAMGLKSDGEERTLIISLYYTDAGEAQDDGDVLVRRMESYSLGTQFENMENIPLTDWLDIGEPTVRSYAGGATLTVSCRFLSEKGNISLLLGAQGTRDTLFLAPDPAAYVKE